MAKFNVEKESLDEIDLLRNSVKELELINKQLTLDLNLAKHNYNAILSSRSWRCLKPFRYMASMIKKILNSNPITRNSIKGLRSIKRNGLKQTYKSYKVKISRDKGVSHVLGNLKLSRKEFKRQRNTIFKQTIKFSILVPLYNTPQKFLEEMIESVKNQSYLNWELCLVDGSDNEYSFVGDKCKVYAKKDMRIIYKKLDKNLGISENTNACIKMATGDYIVLFDHDDLLHPSALYENMKVINEQDADFIYSDENTFHLEPKDAFCPNFKPDFAIDTLRSYNYICHLSVFKKTLLDKVGNFNTDCDGSQDYDMTLRLVEQAAKVVHIPKILYFWRAHKNSVASDIAAKPYVIDSAQKALTDHLSRIGLKAKVLNSSIISTYKIEYEIFNQPLVSILIPNKDNVEDLHKCLKSIFENSTYTNYEVVIVENNSVETSTFTYYASLKKYANITVVTWDGKFNYSAINNFGVTFCKGEHIIFLNNDVEVISEKWIEEMLMFSQRADVGAVGAKLYYPDNTSQHGGVILGIGGVGGHAHKYFDRNAYGYMSRLCIVQNLSCVTAACMMMSRDVFEQIKGFDENYAVAFNDVDLCMRIRSAGYNIVWTPYAELYHYESKSRGNEDTPEKQKRFEGEVLRFKAKWAKELEAGDPYYNTNLTLEREDFSFK